MKLEFASVLQMVHGGTSELALMMLQGPHGTGGLNNDHDDYARNMTISYLSDSSPENSVMQSNTSF